MSIVVGFSVVIASVLALIVVRTAVVGSIVVAFADDMAPIVDLAVIFGRLAVVKIGTIMRKRSDQMLSTMPYELKTIEVVCEHSRHSTAFSL